MQQTQCFQQGSCQAVFEGYRNLFKKKCILKTSSLKTQYCIFYDLLVPKSHIVIYQFIIKVGIISCSTLRMTRRISSCLMRGLTEERHRIRARHLITQGTLGEGPLAGHDPKFWGAALRLGTRLYAGLQQSREPAPSRCTTL